MDNKTNKIAKYKSIHELEVQKEILKRQLSNLLFDNEQLSNEDFAKINEHKKTIADIDNQVQAIKNEIEELDKNNRFECSYSTITENGKTVETYKVNDKEVSKSDYIKAIKENNLLSRNNFDGFFKKFNFDFLDHPFFGERLLPERKHLGDRKSPRKECDCHHHEKEKDDRSFSLFDLFF